MMIKARMKQRVRMLVNLSIALRVTLDESNSSAVFCGYWEMAMVHPIEMRPIEKPSTFQRNFSFSIKGESIAVMMMQKQLVDEIRMMLPYFRATIRN